MKIAELNSDNTVKRVFNAKAVNVGDGDALIHYPKSIFTLWSDAELNAIGFAKFDEEHVPSNHRITGTTDTFIDGCILRTHTSEPRPEPTDPEPYLIITEAYTEEVPAVMSEDGLTEITPATTIEHPAVTEPNPAYDYVSLRQRDYPSREDMIVALWEHGMESRPEAAAALESERQAVKAKFPKVSIPPLPGDA